MAEISVIVISHNSQKFIEETLNSICAQTYRDIEVLVVDDGSTDASKAIVNEIMQRDDRVVLVDDSQKLSRSQARNYGAEKAKGKYVAFCDSDDVWAADKLEKQMNVIKSFPETTFVYTGCDFINEDSEPMGVLFEVPQSLTYKSMLKRNHVVCSSTLIDKQVYLEHPMHGDFVGKNDKYREDYVSWLAILKAGNEARGVNLPLVHYRIVTQSVSSKKVKAFFQTYRTLRFHKHNFISSYYYTFCQFLNSRKKYKGVKRAK